jgi:hypothetical protein
MGFCRWVAVLLSVAAALAGCHKTWRGQVNQPNPLAYPTETLRSSEAIVIVTGDMELYAPRHRAAYGAQASLMVPERYPLRNVAIFTVVSRDRVRVHLQLEHKWQEYVDVRSWRARLVDDRGRVYEPVSIDRSGETHVVEMWDYETRSAVRNSFGDVVSIRDDGHRRRQTLGSLSVFRGRGDFVFYSRDLFRSDLRTLTFIVDRGSMTFFFTWRFVEPGADDDEEPAVAVR